jgi:quercetin dioxygenase-like cupin family protein
LLKPGERLRRHVTPVDVMFYVLEGKGVVEIGDEKMAVGKDTVIHSPAKIVHCWYNESDSDLRVLVVKTPRPTESTVLL